MGGQPNPPVIEKIGKIPLFGQAGPPSAEARRQIYRVFLRIFLGNFEVLIMIKN